MYPSAMTRSLYVTAKDRQAEVARRRKEHEDKARLERENKIRMANERAEKALQRKQKDLMEKITKNKQHEQERLKDIKKKREELQKQEEERLKEITAKKSSTRSSPSRSSANRPVAFGSTAPRDLNFGAGRPTPTRQRSSLQSNTPNKLAAGFRSSAQKTDLMARSVYGGSSNLTRNSNIMSQSMYSAGSNRSTLVRPKPVGNSTPAKQSVMTRSMYTPSKADPGRGKSRAVPSHVTKSAGTLPPHVKKVAPPPRLPISPDVTTTVMTTDVEPTLVIIESVAEAPGSNASTESIVPADPIIGQQSEDSDNESGGTVELAAPTPFVHPPVIDPPTEECGVHSEEPVHVAEPVMHVESDPFKKYVDDVHNETVPDKQTEGNPPDFPVEYDSPASVDSNEVPNGFIKSAEEKSSPVLIEDVGLDQNISISNEISATVNGFQLPNGLKSSALLDEGSDLTQSTLNGNDGAFVDVLSSPIWHETDGAQQKWASSLGTDASLNGSQSSSPNPVGTPTLPTRTPESPPLKALDGGPILGLTAKMEQERLNRRQRMAEIMSKNRDDNTTPTTRSIVPDADKLNVKELMARFRSSRNESPTSTPVSQSTPVHEGPARLSVESDRRVTSLADELANLGLGDNNTVLLPGQVPN